MRDTWSTMKNPRELLLGRGLYRITVQKIVVEPDDVLVQGRTWRRFVSVMALIGPRSNDCDLFSLPSTLGLLQSNAVGWLSQSVTDSLKAGQQQVVGAVDTVARYATVWGQKGELVCRVVVVDVIDIVFVC